jgi:predicted dehydrogenase
MKQKIWRVALLGLDHWYSAYGLARAMAEYKKAKLVAVASDDPAKLREFTSAFEVEGTRDFSELLARDDIDIVQIASRVSEIPDLTIQAARAGKHIVLGKPMAMTVEQADEMVGAVETSGVMCVPFQGIMRLQNAELKTRIERGDIGEIVVMHQTSRWSIAEDWYRSGKPGWFVDPKHVPGGALIDEGIYWLDVLRWLAGAEIVKVEAKIANLVHKEIKVEDWGMAFFTFANGIVATLEGSWTINAPHKSGPSPKQNSVVRLEVVGSRGEIIEQFFRDPGRAMLASGASNWVFERRASELFAPGIPMPLDHLIQCLENNQTAIATIHEARKSFIAAMAAYESVRAGRAVVL